MKAVRLGSYSRRSTVAVISNLARLKSMIRYRLLLPPPRQRMVIRPVLLRPPLPRRPSVNALTDLPFHSPLRSTTTSCRCDGVVGLKVFNAIASDSCRDVDPLTLAERDDCLLIVRTPPDTTAKTFQLALDLDRVDRGNLDLEQAFDGCLDLTLCGSQRHTKNHLVVFGGVRRLLGDHRRADDVKHLLLSQRRRDARDHAKPAHLRRASSCRTASRVRTSVSRRKMSKTFAPCCGITSTRGRLRVARAKFSSTTDPSIINTESQPSAASRARNTLVLASPI